MRDINEILKFVKFTLKFREIDRQIHLPKTKQLENDAEHSYQLAMLAWYLIDTKKLKLNKEKVLKYALAHDLVETYAGDTFIFSKNKKHLSSKHKREQKALKRIEKEFSNAKEIIRTIHQYEKRKDKESKFIYCLDKIISPINIYIEGGHTWRQHNLTLDRLIDNKAPKVKLDRNVEIIFEDLVKILKRKEKDLF